MNKILNWTFGSCFRTLGRFLSILIVFALLLFVGSKLDILLPSFLVIRVNAASEGFNWYEKNVKNTILSSRILDWTSNTNYNIINTTYDYISPLATASIPDNNYQSLKVGQNGVSYQIYLDQQLRTDFLYSVEMYVCTPTLRHADMNNFRFDIKSGINPNESINNKPVFTFSTISEIPVQYLGDHGIQNYKAFDWCGIYTALIAPSVNGAWLEYKAKAPAYTSNYSLNIFPYLMGYSMQELGIYNATVERYVNNAIANSGIATSSNINEVKSMINELETGISDLNSTQQETNNKLDDVNQSIQDTNDTITDSSSPDVSDMTNLAGYLPPGPLDSVLNLPLSILNSLNTKLSSSCTPLTFTLPFVNLPLNIPCLSTIFSQIEGLNILWESLGVILGALIMYKYLVYLYNWVDDVTSLHHNKARLFGAKSDADNWGRVD